MSLMAVIASHEHGEDSAGASERTGVVAAENSPGVLQETQPDATGAASTTTAKGKRRATTKPKEPPTKKLKQPTKTEIALQKGINELFREEGPKMVAKARDEAVRSMQASFNDQFEEQISALTQLRHEVIEVDIEGGAFKASDDGQIHIRTSVVTWSNMQAAVADRDHLRQKVNELETETATRKQTVNQQAAEIAELRESLDRLTAVVTSLQQGGVGPIGVVRPSAPTAQVPTVAAAAAAAVAAAVAAASSRGEGSGAGEERGEGMVNIELPVSGTPSKPRKHPHLNQSFLQDFYAALDIVRGQDIPGWSGRDEDLPKRPNGTPLLRFTWNERVDDRRVVTWLMSLACKYIEDETARTIHGTEGMTEHAVMAVLKKQWASRRATYQYQQSATPAQQEKDAARKRRTARKHARISDIAKAAAAAKFHGPGWTAALDPVAVPVDETTDEEEEGSTDVSMGHSGRAEGGGARSCRGADEGVASVGGVGEGEEHRPDNVNSGASGAESGRQSDRPAQATPSRPRVGRRRRGQQVETGQPVRRVVPAWMSWELVTFLQCIEDYVDKSSKSLRPREATYKTVWRDPLPASLQPWMIDGGWKERHADLLADRLPLNGGPFDGSGPARSAREFGTALRLPVRLANGSELPAGDPHAEPNPDVEGGGLEGDAPSPIPTRYGPEASTCTKVKELMAQRRGHQAVRRRGRGGGVVAVSGSQQGTERAEELDGEDDGRIDDLDECDNQA